MAALIRTRTRDEWCALLERTDTCFAPVLSMEEAYAHPHNVQRGTFTEVAGVVQPAPAPRFSRTVPTIAGPPPRPGEHTNEALSDWGFSAAEVAELRASDVLR
jgi:alpha-methylacyl-CoA racemase